MKQKSIPIFLSLFAFGSLVYGEDLREGEALLEFLGSSDCGRQILDSDEHRALEAVGFDIESIEGNGWRETSGPCPSCMSSLVQDVTATYLKDGRLKKQKYVCR